MTLTLVGQVMALCAVAAWIPNHHLVAFAKPITVPAVKSWVPDSSGSAFSLPTNVNIIVDAKSADLRDQAGLTLIPPTLHEFATTFSLDLGDLFPRSSPRLSAGNQVRGGSIFLTVNQSSEYTLANGNPTSEGYTLHVLPQSVTVLGASPLGVWRGVTTLLQGLVQGNSSYPVGTVVDQPDWPTRGVMLDIGRQWYPAHYLKEMCAYISYFKASEFHLHLSDNLPALLDGDSTYARFRLHSTRAEFTGLTPHVNETYSREEFDDLQRSCAARGVTIVPEIEAPGHALVITQWKPQLALSNDPTLLNLSLPESTQTMKDIWDEFLPWIHSKQVSIGADEYSGALADDYLHFVANMSQFIQETSNKTIRSWGTFEPSDTLTLTKNTTVQHWAASEDNAFQLLESGYRLINSDDSFLYIVMKQSGGFPQKLDQDRIWTGNTQGGPWDPTKFDSALGGQAAHLTSPTLLGGIMAIWSDQGPTASTPLEAFYAFKMGLPVVAANSWHAVDRPTALTRAQFDSVFDVLEASAPGQNLDRDIESEGEQIVSYDFRHGVAGNRVKDSSGNGFDATLAIGITKVRDGVMLRNGAHVSTPLGSKGANYTLSLSFSTTMPIASASATLLSGPDTSLILSQTGNSTTALAVISSNITYPLSNFTFSSGNNSISLVIQGTEDTTTVFVNGTRVGDFEVLIRRAGIFRPMSFVAPLAQIGGPGFSGIVSEMVLLDGLHNPEAASH